VSPANTSRIGEQNTAYRKGLVLGLTMAEVGIRIIFVLLLLIAVQELRRDQLAEHFRDKVPVDNTRLASLVESHGALNELAKALELPPTAPPEDFTKLVRVVTASAATAEGRSSLVEARQLLAEMRAATRQAEAIARDAKMSGAPELSRRLSAQSYRIANQDGQLKRYEQQLERAGQGKGERPCWVQPDGRIDYLYDVVLTSQGIRMREIPHDERAAERVLLPMPTVSSAEVLAPAEFLRRTQPLFNYSANANCRFFVVIYDGTAVHEKPLYKSLLQSVEGHFYKRLSDAAPPF
jgi:hypothetical protein